MLDGEWYQKQGFKTLKEARKEEQKKRDELERERQARMIDTVTCLDLTNKYLDHVKARMVHNTFVGCKASPRVESLSLHHPPNKFS